MDLTRAQVAEEMGVSRTHPAKRLLPKIPNLRCNRVGRKITFSPQDVALIQEAVRCPYTTASAAANVARARPGPCPARKPSSSTSSAQERVRALTRKPSGPRAK